MINLCCTKMQWCMCDALLKLMQIIVHAQIIIIHMKINYIRLVYTPNDMHVNSIYFVYDQGIIIIYMATWGDEEGMC